MGLISDDLARRIAADYQGKVLAGYEIQGLHRAGGTSVVLSATRDKNDFAVKIYAKDLFDDKGAELERIKRQVETKDICHPNVVRTYTAGLCADFGYHYLVMDFINDPTITEKLHELTEPQIRHVLQQTAKAALFMHDTMALVHRDIKPDNIAIREKDDHVTLLDLGLVRPVVGLTVTDQTGVKHPKGTKEYAPPELLDSMVTPDKDGWLAVTFYQLGATLYEMLTRRRPFSEYQGQELIDAIHKTMPPIDSSAAPPDLVKLCLDCLTKDPAIRRQLVTRHRFFNAPEQDTGLDALNELIATLPKKEPHLSLFPKGAQEQQQIQRCLYEVSNDVEMSIRSFLSGKERTFPDYTIERCSSFSLPNGFAFTITNDFRKLSISVTTYSVVVVEISDIPSRICQCRLFTSTTRPPSTLDNNHGRVVYSGAFVLLHFRTTIGNELARDLREILSEANEF